MQVPRPDNIAVLNERTFKPNSPDVFTDQAGRQYLPTAYDDEERCWHYSCRINPRHDISYPALGDTIVLRNQHANRRRVELLSINVIDDVVAVGVVEIAFFRRPGVSVPKELRDIGVKISNTVGIVTLRKHPTFLKNIKTWH